MTDRMEGAVGCYDAVGRRRWLRVARSEGGVRIVVPPGEVAEVGAVEIEQLRRWLARLAAAGPESAIDGDRRPR